MAERDEGPSPRHVLGSVRLLTAQCVDPGDLRRILESVRDHAQMMIQFGEHQCAQIASGVVLLF